MPTDVLLLLLKLAEMLARVQLPLQVQVHVQVLVLVLVVVRLHVLTQMPRQVQVRPPFQQQYRMLRLLAHAAAT